jgi:hypothetical protein
LSLKLQAGQTINDVPAITTDSTYGMTLWFRSGTQIVETAAPSLSATWPNPPVAIKPGNNLVFASAPAVTAGVTLDEGQYVIVARQSNPSVLEYITDSNNPSTQPSHFGE